MVLKQLSDPASANYGSIVNPFFNKLDAAALATGAIASPTGPLNTYPITFAAFEKKDPIESKNPSAANAISPRRLA